MDMSRRRCFLQCLHHLGRGWTNANVRTSWFVLEDELFLPHWPSRAGASVDTLSHVPREEMDQTH